MGKLQFTSLLLSFGRLFPNLEMRNRTTMQITDKYVE